MAMQSLGDLAQPCRAAALAERIGVEVRAGAERFEELRKRYLSIRDRRQRSATMIQEASQWFDEAPSALDRGCREAGPQQGHQKLNSEKSSDGIMNLTGVGWS